MERAGKLLGQSKLAARCLTGEQLALASWPAAVGRKIAGRTKAVRLVRERLVVEVDDVIWRKQLYSLRAQILARFDKVVGPGLVCELEFKVVPPRRQPAVETRLVRDEADAIEDPVLSRIYRASRKKEMKRSSA
jgi:predicted nucleic acid-binding Zn ribbon protein